MDPCQSLLGGSSQHLSSVVRSAAGSWIRSFKLNDWRRSARILVSKGLIVSQPILSEPSVRKKFSRSVLISFPAQNLDSVLASFNLKQSSSSTRKAAVLRLLAKEKEPAEISWIYASTGANSTDLRWLEQKGFISFQSDQVWRDPLKNTKADLHYTDTPKLTAEQNSVWMKIESLIGSAHPCKAHSAAWGYWIR